MILKFIKAFKLALSLMKIDESKNTSKNISTFYGRQISKENNPLIPENVRHLTKEKISEQIHRKCLKCGSDAKTSALNRETKRIMVTCLKCNDWIDFE